MSADSTVSTQRTRLMKETRGSPVGGGGWGVVVFGSLFLAAGVFAALAGSGVIEVEQSGDDAPPWVLAVIGAVFGLVGLFVVIMGLRNRRRWRQFLERRTQHPNEPWLADYPWDRERSTDSAFGRIARHFAIAAFLVLFLSPFNWGVFAKDAPLFVKFVIGLFDLMALLVLGNAMYLLLRWLKYGSSYVRFGQFPFFLGGTLEADWCSPRGIGRYEHITFTLRCVEEVMETTGSGKNRSQTLVCYQVWADTYEVAGPGEHRGDESIPVTFLLPAEGTPTVLSQHPPRYWELEIKATTPGVDYGAVYLLPVYAKERAEMQVYEAGAM